MNVLLDSTDFSNDWAFERFSEFIHTKSRIAIIPFAYHDEWIRDKSEWYECYGKSEGRFYKSLIKPFLDYGVQENNIRFINY